MNVMGKCAVIHIEAGCMHLSFFARMHAGHSCYTVWKGTLEALPNIIHQQIDPKVFSSLTVAYISGKAIIVLQVDESPIKRIVPVTHNTDGKISARLEASGFNTR